MEDKIITTEQIEEILDATIPKYTRTLEGLAMGEAFDVDEFFKENGGN